jgi:hypothetical protein
MEELMVARSDSEEGLITIDSMTSGSDIETAEDTDPIIMFQRPFFPEV